MSTTVDNSLKIISWNVTRRCNLKCNHCYLPADFRTEKIEDSDNSCELNTEEALRLIDQIALVNNETMLVLSGGEPLLRSDIYTLARYASGKGIMVVVGTNGYFIISSVIAKLKESGVSGVSISLDSIDPVKHDGIRQIDGSWYKAVDAIKTCKSAGLSVQLNTVITKSNYDEIPELIQYARSLGVRVFSPFFLVCTGKGEELTDISPEQYEELLSVIIRLQEKRTGLMIRTRCAPTFRRILYQRHPDSSLLKLDAGKCMAGIHYCRITPEGKVTSCPYMTASAGSVKEDGFHHIWNNSPEFAALRNPSLKGKCSVCEYQRLCGGCRARAYAMNGDIMAEDPWCAFTPESREVISPPLFSSAPIDTLSNQESSPVWTREAEDRLKRVPFFVRTMVRSAIDRYALKNQYTEITPEIMMKARQNYGMDKMAGK